MQVENRVSPIFQHHKSLGKYIGSRVQIQCEGDRILVGNLISIDRFCNALLMDTEEDITGSKLLNVFPPMRKCIVDECIVSGSHFKQHGLLFIRGSTINFIGKSGTDEGDVVLGVQ